MTRADNLSAQLAVLTGRGEGHGWLELRYRHQGGMRTRFYPAGANHRALRALIARHAARTDVYIGCALRDHQRGDKAAIGEAWTVWAECDTPGAAAAAQAFDPPPTLVIASGTPDHVHAYWGLRRPIGADQLEDANRRLADALGADPACCDRGRVLRPCGSWSHKHRPPVAVVATAGSSALYSLAEITADLPELVPAAVAADTPRAVDDDPLLAISPRVYVPVLTRQSLGVGSKVRCPRHADRTPSLHAYPTAEQGWFCFGACRRGGSIIDLASAVWSIEPRGDGYQEIRRRLQRLRLDQWNRLL